MTNQLGGNQHERSDAMTTAELRRRAVVSACSCVVDMFDQGVPDALIDEAIDRLARYFSDSRRR